MIPKMEKFTRRYKKKEHARMMYRVTTNLFCITFSFRQRLTSMYEILRTILTLYVVDVVHI